MARKVEGYFKNENDAESAKASLQSIKSTSVFIEEMPGNEDTKMYAPFFTTNIEAAGASNNLGTIGKQAPFIVNENHGEVTHLLYFDVNEEDYDQALAIMKEHHCFNFKY